MRPAPLPDDEAARLEALRRYAILDTAPEEAFDEITALAGELCGTPIALVSLIDEDRQWFKSRVGLAAPETHRDLAFCAHAILEDGIFIVPDALQDERFADNPLVEEDPSIRFYAGSPLVTNDGHKLGTLCVIDRVPRQLTPLQLRALHTLGRQVIDQIELRRTVSSLARNVLELRTAREAIELADREREAKGGDRVQSAFLAQATHDLRTPLNAILGYAELLLDSDDDDPALAVGSEAEVVLGKVVEAGGYMLRLVNDILDIARLEAEHLAIETAEVDLEGVTRAVVETMRSQSMRNHNRVRIAVESGLGTISSDATRIRQSLFNLLSNACKFTTAGEIAVELRAPAEGWVVIDVRDSGIGMNQEELGRLFRPFVQVQDEPSERGESTGLGLVLTRSLCERLGGSLEVESEPGVGSTFTIWLPRRPPAEETRGVVAVVEGRGRSQNRALLSRTLRSWDLQPIFYESVASLLWSIGERRIDGVIIDHTAPGGDEERLLQGLGATGAAEGIKLVAVADDGDDEAPCGMIDTIACWRVGDGVAALAGLLGVKA